MLLCYSHTWQNYLSLRPLFPSKFKLALISSLLKTKPGLPKSDLANFRPIFNLNTIGKILERLAFHVFSSHFKISRFFSFIVCSLLTANFIILRLLCLSSQMISWKPLTPEKLQFSRLWICPQPLILWTTLHFFVDFSTLSVYRVMLFLDSFVSNRPLILCENWFVILTFHYHTHRRASGLCSRSTTFRPFHITNCKCHKVWPIKPK